MSEDAGRREQAHKHVLNPERSNFQVKTFPVNEKETCEDAKRRKQAHKSSTQP